MLTGSIKEGCHVDITGPQPRTVRGSKYILTCVDAFCKWAEAFPLPNKEAKIIAIILVEQVFCRFGTQVALLTDNAGELDGKLMSEICRLLDIDKQHTSFYHPETNSVAERFHGTLNAMMDRVVSDSQHNWDLTLSYVMAAYRAALHQSTGYTPMFAWENRAPADLVLGIPNEDTATSYDDYSVEMDDRMKAYQVVRQHLGTSVERMKRRYDLRIRPQALHKTQWVLYCNPWKHAGRQQKWQRKYTPQLIVEELPPVNYRIKRSRRARPFIAHDDKLPAWKTDDVPKYWLPNQPSEYNEHRIQLLSDAGNNQLTVKNSDDYTVADDCTTNEYLQPVVSDIKSSGSENSDTETSVLPDETAIAGVPTSASQLALALSVLFGDLRVICDNFI